MLNPLVVSAPFRLTWHAVSLVDVLRGVGLSALCLAAMFFLQGHIGFSLWDEGFLWYGVQRVLAGEVPLRDFMAYDPGRYVWSATWLSLFGDAGLVALRASIILFQWIGLSVAVVLVMRSQTTRDWRSLLLATMILLSWMVPQHKLFDISLSIICVAAYSVLLEKPLLTRFFGVGLFIGVAAIFGRNHGFYGVITGIGAIAYLAATRPDIGLLRGISAWFTGIVAGYGPFLISLLVIPGYAASFVDGILLLAQQENTNLPLPIPWPWLAEMGEPGGYEMVRALLIGGFFLALPLFGLGGLLGLLHAHRRATTIPSVLPAAILASLPYTHYAFARADVGHLAQGVFPLLIGVLVLAASLRPLLRVSLLAMLLLSSAVVALPLQPGWSAWRSGNWSALRIQQDRFLVDPDTANNYKLLRDLVKCFAPDGRSFLAVPYWPGAYAALGRASPTWEIYPLFPRGKDFELKEIDRIRAAQPGFIVILDRALDNVDARRFRNTHPVTNRYISEHFVPVRSLSIDADLRIYKAPDWDRSNGPDSRACNPFMHSGT